ncbi:M23 family metallopeptidase [uncultured Desulfobulbus sp.]|uniref:M23 family metallopeptidase n=1 Tax=uncultured Desulfobulbus sp. TaxID=239745 RepID=UPI0029C75A80|nr:M23 family metallopeptidase [uncultured Desulfobulbus sp.]
MAKHIRLRSSSRRGGFFKTFFLALASLAAVALVVVAFLLFEFEKPTLVLEKEIKYLGGKVELPLRVTDQKSGISSIVITLKQGEKTEQLLEKTFPRQAWFKPAGPASISEKVVIDAQKAGIKEGQAELLISVRDFSLNGLFKGNETLQRIPVTMDTKPPKVTIAHAQRAIHPGGSGIVLYTISEPPGKHGVMIDTTFFPGFPLGKKDAYICYFALPWDAKQPEKMRVIGNDEAGNETSLPLITTFKKELTKRDSINLSELFLQQKIPEFEQHYPEMKGTLVEKYLYVNNQVRQSNAQTIAQACSATDSQQLWADRFLRMFGSGRAGYADQRTYMYNGTAIDTQTHLGVDIASLERAEIRAANRGKVVFATYLGIYGNAVIIDHGQGIASLYSHLSSIDTTVGTLVEKDQPIGHSGATGMAGGDHLHFSMLVHGIFVTPIEWWDQHWIDVNIKSVLNAL